MHVGELLAFGILAGAVPEPAHEGTAGAEPGETEAMAAGEAEGHREEREVAGATLAEVGVVESDAADDAAAGGLIEGPGVVLHGDDGFVEGDFLPEGASEQPHGVGVDRPDLHAAAAEFLDGDDVAVVGVVVPSARGAGGIWVVEAGGEFLEGVGGSEDGVGGDDEDEFAGAVGHAEVEDRGVVVGFVPADDGSAGAGDEFGGAVGGTGIDADDLVGFAGLFLEGFEDLGRVEVESLKRITTPMPGRGEGAALMGRGGSDFEEGADAGEDVFPGDVLAGPGLEDDEDGLGSGSAEREPADGGLPPVAGGGSVAFAAVGEPVDGLGGGTTAFEDEVASRAAGDGAIALLGDGPTGSAEAVERVVDGVSVAGAVDDLEDDAVRSDLVDALDEGGLAENLTFGIGEGQFAGGEAQALGREELETGGGVVEGDEFPGDGECGDRADADPEGFPGGRSHGEGVGAGVDDAGWLNRPERSTARVPRVARESRRA